MELMILSKGFMPIGCKWILKNKKGFKRKIARHKARLVAKGFTHQEGVDYNETSCPVSSKDSFKVLTRWLLISSQKYIKWTSSLYF